MALQWSYNTIKDTDITFQNFIYDLFKSYICLIISIVQTVHWFLYKYNEIRKKWKQMHRYIRRNFYHKKGISSSCHSAWKVRRLQLLHVHPLVWVGKFVTSAWLLNLLNKVPISIRHHVCYTSESTIWDELWPANIAYTKQHMQVSECIVGKHCWMVMSLIWLQY